jgi:hypothetical protein
MTAELDADGRVQRLREWPIAQVVGTDSTFRPDQPSRPAHGAATDRRTHGR